MGKLDKVFIHITSVVLAGWILFLLSLMWKVIKHAL